MKKSLLFTLPLVLLLFSFRSLGHDDHQTVNPVIGDLSFVKTYGCNPNEETEENFRIRTHLSFVEAQLRSRDVSMMPTHLREQRSKMLDLLHEYREAGQFPVNYDYPGERRPCFIDRDGNICAVGYLLEQTAGRVMAEAVNARYKYAEIGEMKMPELYEWIAESGLNAVEVAMIQPAYSAPPTTTEASYAIPTAAWSGLNGSLCAVNFHQLFRTPNRKIVPALGLVSGAGQTVYGILKWPEDVYDPWSGQTLENTGHKVLSFVNIGLGTGTMIMSTVNLLANRGERNTVIGMYSPRLPEGGQGVGLSFSRRF